MTCTTKKNAARVTTTLFGGCLTVTDDTAFLDAIASYGQNLAAVDEVASVVGCSSSVLGDAYSPWPNRDG